MTALRLLRAKLLRATWDLPNKKKGSPQEFKACGLSALMDAKTLLERILSLHRNRQRIQDFIDKYTARSLRVGEAHRKLEFAVQRIREIALEDPGKVIPVEAAYTKLSVALANGECTNTDRVGRAVRKVRPLLKYFHPDSPHCVPELVPHFQLVREAATAGDLEVIQVFQSYVKGESDFDSNLILGYIQRAEDKMWGTPFAEAYRRSLCGVQDFVIEDLLIDAYRRQMKKLLGA